MTMQPALYVLHGVLYLQDMVGYQECNRGPNTADVLAESTGSQYNTFTTNEIIN